MIPLEQAKKALEASEHKAKELGLAVTTAIVDTHGSLIALSRMDGAIPISPKFATTKAFTAANLGMQTSDLAGYEAPEKPLYGLHALFAGELTSLAGGVPVVIHGKVVGGIGVGGSKDVSQDAECAQAAKRILEA